MSTKVPVVFGSVVFLFTVAVIWHLADTGRASMLGLGEFAVLAVTLIVLGFYAHDTNSIARVARENWKRQNVLNTTYSMDITVPKGGLGRTLFRIHNPSTLVVKAKVRCNFRVYDAPVDCQGALDGTEIWIVFPQQTSQGWFEIESLVQKKGKTVTQMTAEQTPENGESQLTMDLELEFRDELGERRVLPSRHAFFDFNHWAWVPTLTTKGDWV